jgi:dihydroorotate dehydrogenase electron transfer subunit
LKVIENISIAPDIYSMRVLHPRAVAVAEPGQFMHVRCSNTTAPLLRRPLSIAGIDRDAGVIRFVYRVVGEGTRILSEMVPGQELDMLGPLGTGFPIPDDKTNAVLIGGGVGVAPLLFLCQRLSELWMLEDKSPQGKTKNATDKRESKTASEKTQPRGTAVFGFTTKSQAFGLNEIDDGFIIIPCTDDGSLGHKGYPSELLEVIIASGKRPDILYACGPRPLMAKVKRLAEKVEIPTYISLEEHMACGIGACLGCAVKSSAGVYKKVCSDGPVFKAQDVEL